jgi:hypothetical protein
LPTNTIADAIVGLAKAREAATAHQTASMSEVLGQELKSFLSSQSLKEKIEVIEKQISVVSRRAL